MYSANEVARYIIKRCNEKNKSISNLKLQKILYFLQAEFLVNINDPCFYDKIEAWDFGPVVPNVYHNYKIFGCASIPFIGADDFQFNNDDLELMNGIIDECSEYSAARLVEITHNQTPWKEAYFPNSNNSISNESIKNFFDEN